MAGFVCITDSHFGAEPSVYNGDCFHVQQGYPERAQELTDALSAYIQKQDIDVVIHAGDMIHEADIDLIQNASSLFTSLPVPVFFCLGNHDLTAPQAKEWWLEYGSALFPEGKVNFTLNLDDCMIHVVPNQWGEAVYEWISDQTPGFLPEQYEFLEQGLETDPEKIHIIVTHSPVRGIPAAQTGTVKQHVPDSAFTDCFSALKKKYPQLHIVISGHNHHNMHVSEEGCHYVSCSAFCESPFECKLFTIEHGSVEMITHSLGPDAGFEYSYDSEKSSSQGRPCDRTFKKDVGIGT